MSIILKLKTNKFLKYCVFSCLSNWKLNLIEDSREETNTKDEIQSKIKFKTVRHLNKYVKASRNELLCENNEANLKSKLICIRCAKYH